MATGTSKPHAEEVAALDALFTGDTWVALFTALTTAQGEAGGTGATEVTGGSYARQKLTGTGGVGGYTKTTNTTGTTASFNAMNFVGMPAVTVVGFAIYDAVTGGNMKRYVPGLSYTTLAGQILTFPATTGITVQED